MEGCYSFCYDYLRCHFTARALGSFTFARAEEAEVMANYRRLERVAGISPERIVRPYLANGDRVARVGEGDAGRGVTRQPGHLQGVDAVYTDSPQLYIAITTADCYPVIIYDRRRRAVGIAHCGWRGIVNRLEQKLIAAMTATLGCQPRDMLAVIGPGIGRCCYRQHDDGLRRAFASYNGIKLIDDNDDGTYNIDIALALRANLADAGITQIVCTGLCTGCNQDFFSARREGFATGRTLSLAAIIADREAQ